MEYRLHLLNCYVGEVRALGDAIGRDAEIFIEDANVLAPPPKLERPLDGLVLPIGRFAIALHLVRTGLADVDEGAPAEVARPPKTQDALT